MIKTAIGAVIIVTIVFAYAMCRASGEASRWEEEMYGTYV